MPRCRRTDKRRQTWGRDQRTELDAGPEMAALFAGLLSRNRFASEEERRAVAEHSFFDSDEDRRTAWFAHRDELLAGCYPGTRPWGFWFYEVDRPDLAKGGDGKDVERIRVLAEGNYLTPDEAVRLQREGDEARERIGTGAEQKYGGGEDGPDRRAAAIADVIRTGG